MDSDKELQEQGYERKRRLTFPDGTLGDIPFPQRRSPPDFDSGSIAYFVVFAHLARRTSLYALAAVRKSCLVYE